MIIYLTFNDLPSGIYSSQVIDVVKFISKNNKVTVRLVAFISLRNFFANRKLIKNEMPDAIILPMFPGIHNWRYNRYLLRLLFLIYAPEKVLGRSVLATQLAFISGARKVIYDGRGAIEREWREYGVVNNSKMLAEIGGLEKECVVNSDFNIAVSQALVKYWQEIFGYKKGNYVIIPCTLNKIFKDMLFSEKAINDARKALGFASDDIVLVYSGSVSGWQSFQILDAFLIKELEANEKVKVMFLSPEHSHITKLKEKYGKRITSTSVKVKEVPFYLMAADYGLMIREESITNKVASPVKFAEYLSCGLKVIISDNLGDYSEFVLRYSCGYKSEGNTKLEIVDFETKKQVRALGLSKFTKEAYQIEYKTLSDLE